MSATATSFMRLGVRERASLRGLLCLAAVAGVVLAALWQGDAAGALDPARRLSPPSAAHWFGTDALGRDLFARTLAGLALSLWVGLLASAISTIVAALLALLAVAGGRVADAIVAYVVDMALGLPHLMLLILVSFALGGGSTAIVIAVALTHWPRLTRILRAELLQVLQADYVHASRRFGKSWSFVARAHLAPHMTPHMFVGFLLLFPHAILHEAGLTFLGFGFEPTRPAIGVLLAESLRTLTAGHWWLGLFPGLSLIALVLLFDMLAGALRDVLSPTEGQT